MIPIKDPPDWKVRRPRGGCTYFRFALPGTSTHAGPVDDTNTYAVMEPTGDIAVIGLAVMGQNLILNMNDHGFTVVAYNRTTAKVDEFLANEAKGTNVQGAHSIAEMVSKLKRPRRVMLMVKAGSAVDDFIAQLLPHHIQLA